jgi:hypothetical protein
MIMETTFLFDMICLMAGISAVFRLIGRLPESSADIRMPDGNRTVSGQLLPEANNPLFNRFSDPLHATAFHAAPVTGLTGASPGGF